MRKINSILLFTVFLVLAGCNLVIRPKETSTTASSNSSISTNQSTNTTPSSSTTITTITGTNSTIIITTYSTGETVITTYTNNTTVTTSNDPNYGYYLNAYGKTGEALKDALHNIIDDHREISYSAVWEALKETDEDPNNSNNVILFYSGISRSKNMNGGNTGDWNREHIWPQSHGNFGTSMGEGTDLHHLRPTDVRVNSARSNKDFDWGGNIYSGCTILVCKTDSDSFEPDDSVKGDVARMIFYMAVRYEGDVSGEDDLELNDRINSSQDTKVAYTGKLSVLLEWNLIDPVDDFERRRNDVIFEDYQHNRNPFIDHPEFADLIWG